MSFIIFFLFQLCQASQAFSTLTVPESHDILLLLENTMSSSLYLGIVQITIGTSIACVYELHLLFLHTVLLHSIHTIVILVCDHNTMSSRRFVIAICRGNASCQITSARICQSFLLFSIPSVAIFNCFPRIALASLTKLMNCGPFTPPMLRYNNKEQ